MAGKVKGRRMRLNECMLDAREGVYQSWGLRPAGEVDVYLGVSLERLDNGAGPSPCCPILREAFYTMQRSPRTCTYADVKPEVWSCNVRRILTKEDDGARRVTWEWSNSVWPGCGACCVSWIRLDCSSSPGVPGQASLRNM